MFSRIVDTVTGDDGYYVFSTDGFFLLLRYASEKWKVIQEGSSRVQEAILRKTSGKHNFKSFKIA